MAHHHDIFPKRWGEHAWAMFHAAALSAPDTIGDADQARLRAFYDNFGGGLPCSECRAHYAEHYPKRPPPVGDRRALVEWTIDTHNGVNRGTGKALQMSYDAALQHWTNHFGQAFAVPGYAHITPQSLVLPAALAGTAAVVALQWFQR